jgi:UDP-3-O-[3-hydroxymyristoyl] glucosamine N-acyltransferase
MSGHTVAALAQLVGGRVVGAGDRAISGVSDLKHSGPEEIGFVRSASYLDAARASRAGALITPQEFELDMPQIVVEDAYAAFAKVAQLFHPAPTATEHRIHPNAIVHAEATLTAPVQVRAGAVIGRAVLGPGCTVMEGTVIGDGCSLGRDCVLHPNVTLGPGVRLRDRVVIHPGTVVGSDGFGYAREGSHWLKVPQVGSVLIDDDVEIGANCAIDRATMGETRIGKRTKIDNLCHIAHNVVLGADCAITAGCMISGSTTVGDRVTLGGHALLGGHLKVASDTRFGGMSIVFKSPPGPGDYMGFPLQEMRQHVRLQKRLPELVDLLGRVEELERRLKPEGQ